MYQETDEDGTELILAPGEEDNYLCARPGDHLFCPFECDNCAFYRLKGRKPEAGNSQDKLLQTYIRRANLDAFWSRRPGTVEGLTRLFFRQIGFGEDFGFEMFGSPGPFPHDYDSGMRSAIGILRQSQLPGRHEAKQKYSTVRKVRSLNTNVYNASARAIESSQVWRSDKSRFVSTHSPSDSEWHTRFMAGLHSRIGDRRKRDAAISIAQMLAIQDMLEEDWSQLTQDDLGGKRAIAEDAVIFLAGYTASLRGFELPKIVLTSLRTQIDWEGNDFEQPHVGIPLTGRFKARSNTVKKILVFVAIETASGLKPALWIQRLVDVLDGLDIRSGWLFQGSDGAQLRMADLNERFHDILLRLQGERPDLFEPGMDPLRDFDLLRTLRRGATTRATNAGVPGTDIDWINRWNTGGEELESGPMRVIYSDRKQLLETFLRFSLAL